MEFVRLELLVENKINLELKIVLVKNVDIFWKNIYNDYKNRALLEVFTRSI
jgi:hypothetical protein